MDCLTPKQRHKAMLANTSKDTSIELLLRKALWHNKIHYRKNLKVLNCHPDIVLTKYKIAIFCDGDFWHGKRNINKCNPYWKEKIKRNVEKDLENTINLRDNGWIVLRFWESEIRTQLENCVKEVQKSILSRSSS